MITPTPTALLAPPPGPDPALAALFDGAVAHIVGLAAHAGDDVTARLALADAAAGVIAGAIAHADGAAHAELCAALLHLSRVRQLADREAQP